MPAVEILEDRTVPAPFTLTTGTGDGSVTLGVDGFGCFGTAVGGSDTTDATYDPIGTTAAAGTSFISGVAFRMGTTGSRTFLTSGTIGGTGNLTNPTVTGTSTSGTSTFAYSGLSFNLVQAVAPSFNGATQTGSILTQTYRITNTTTGTLNFDLVRYLDGWLRFDGSLIDGGGRLPGPPETFFETDVGGGAATSTTFLGSNATGGTIPTTNRFTFDYYYTVEAEVVAGTTLDDTVHGDGNGDGFVDTGNEFDPARAHRNVFTLAAGATTTYVTQTIFGTGTPNSAVNAGLAITQSGGTTAVTEGGGSDSYTVALNSAPTAKVTIALSSGSQLKVSPATLIFTPTNWNTPQTVTVKAVDDLIYEGSRTANISSSATSSDTDFNGFTIADVSVNITDNDILGITLTQSGGSTNVTEGGTTDSYTLVLTSQPTDNVTITLSPGSQVQVSPAILTFTPTNWKTTQTVRVFAVDDHVIEGPQTDTISQTVTSGDASYNGFALADVTANITDNDFAGVVISQTGGSTTVIEGTTSDSYSIKLQTQPSADVTVTLGPDTRLTVSPTTLIFTTASWNSGQTVAVSVQDDSTFSGSGSYPITHAATSSDANYDGVNVSPVSVNVIDNEGFVINGTPGHDRILVTPSMNSAQVQVIVNNQVTLVPVSVSQLLIYPGMGSDTIQINDPAIPIYISDPQGTESLTIVGSSAYSSFDLGNMTLGVNGIVVGWSGMESLTVNAAGMDDIFTVQSLPDLPLKSVIFNGSNGNDILYGPNVANTWKITGNNAGTLDGLVKFNNIENLTGGTAVDTFTLSSGKSLAGVLDGRGGSNVLDYSLFSVPITVNLQTQAATAITGGMQNISKIIGGKSTDKLTGLDQSNLWNITANNAGDVNGLAFQNFENLVGGSADDTFQFTNGKGISGRIDGGEGNNTLDYSSYGISISFNWLTMKASAVALGFANMQNVVGSATVNDSVSAPNNTNAWTLTGTNTGTFDTGNGVCSFTDVENLNGGNTVDTFTINGSWTGKLNGGLGVDILVGDDSDHAWKVSGLGAGTFEGQSFLGIENLQGGAGNDTFTIVRSQKVTGTIDGGGGSNVLDYTTYILPVTVNLGTSRATGMGNFANIQSFQAGKAGGDTITADNLSNSWTLNGLGTGDLNGQYSFSGFENLNGGTQDDTFTIDAGGLWSGTLNGGLGSDTLIANSSITNHWTTTTLNGRSFLSIETRE